MKLLVLLLPLFVYDKVIQDSENLIAGQPFDKSNYESTLLEDFNKKVNALEIDDKTKVALETRLKTPY